MSKATLARLRRLEVQAGLDGSYENMTDEQLFAAYKALIERAGGAEGEDQLADTVLRYAAC